MRPEKYTQVQCPGCGAWRTLTQRQGRRIAAGKADSLCPLCRNSGAHLPPDDEDRRYWLERFDDEQIPELGEFVFGRGDSRAVRVWPKRLYRPS
jgi:hypothetical protein